MIKLRVQWPNAAHVLLANPTIGVKADETDLSPVAVSLGVQDFELPDFVTLVTLHAAFRGTLPVSGPDKTSEFILLEMTQLYKVDGDLLTPVVATLYNPRGTDLSLAVHPLMPTVSAANAVSGGTLVELRTEFVDMSAQWVGNTPAYLEALRKNDNEDDNRFAAIASTESRPPLWFVHFRKGLQPPTAEVGAMVFFRPNAHYSYANAYDVAHRDRGAFDLSRYLLAPQDDQPVELDGIGPLTDPGRFPYADQNIALRVGWQQAVLRSGKPIVAFHPWATSGTQVGDAATSNLPIRLEQMLRFLHGTGRIGLNHPALTLGRLGISGYSAGWSPTLACLHANRTRIKELYLFDPYQFASGMPYVVDWALKTDDFRLRMTGANFWGQMQTVRRAVKAGVSDEAGQYFVTLKPTRPDFYTPGKPGFGDYWAYATHKAKQWRTDPAGTHQFAIFGGDTIEVDGDKMVSNVTWLEEFLTDSGF